MAIFEEVISAHNTIKALEKSKQEQMQQITSRRHTTIGGIMVALDPAAVAAAAKEVQIKYDALIESQKGRIREELDTAEKTAKRHYYNAIPMGSDYQGEIDRIVRNYENDTRLPDLRKNELMESIREHTEIGDKWALIYVLAGLDIFPDNKEMLECLEKVSPEIADAKAELTEVNDAKRLAEVFELAYYSSAVSISTVDRIHVKNRLAALGADPNFEGRNGEVYEFFCESIGVKYIKPKIVEMAEQIGNDYKGQ